MDYAVTNNGKVRYRGALSHANASVIWREIHSAVWFSVTPMGLGAVTGSGLTIARTIRAI
jgi:hypothetical protein